MPICGKLNCGKPTEFRVIVNEELGDGWPVCKEHLPEFIQIFSVTPTETGYTEVTIIIDSARKDEISRVQNGQDAVREEG